MYILPIIQEQNCQYYLIYVEENARRLDGVKNSHDLEICQHTFKGRTSTERLQGPVVRSPFSLNG